MKYKRSYKGEILVIFAVILSILVMIGSQNSSRSKDPYERLRETRESYKLEEKPMTARDMGV